MGKKPWGVLVYIVADHNAPGTPFKGSADRELRAFITAAGAAGIDVAMQVDFNRQARPVRIVATPKKKGSLARRRPRFHPIDPKTFRVTRAFVTPNSSVKVKVSRGDELNAASPDVLCQFLKWGRKKIKAERYAIFFFGHAAGPRGLFFDNEPGSRTADAMSLAELARAVQSAEVVVFRDCWMSTLEVAYQLHGVAKFAIATQAQATLRGRWPYADLFAILQATAERNEKAVARAMTMRIGTHYDSKDNRHHYATVPFTLLDLRRVNGLTMPLRALARALDDARFNRAAFPAVRRALELARSGHVDSASHPGDNALLDLHTLCSNLEKFCRVNAIRKAAQVLKSALPKVSAFHHSQGNHFSGVSIYYQPLTDVAVNRSFVAPLEPAMYSTLALSQATSWDRIALDPLRTVEPEIARGR
jgi:cysteine peptidase C11 family protein